MTSIPDIGRTKAEETLLKNGSPLGLLAASQSYQQVWARDSMVSGFGLMLTASPEGPALHRRSMDTLRRFQSELGNIPHNVGMPVYDPALVEEGGVMHAEDGNEGPVRDTAHAGCIDNSLWYILGNYYTWSLDGDLERLKSVWDSLLRAHLWLRYQDSNECGLLEAHEAKDWADLFANRYNTLLPNVLWFAAHKALAAMGRALGLAEQADAWAKKAEEIRFKVNTLLWLGPEAPRDRAWVERHRAEWTYAIRLTDIVLQQRPYFLPYMAFRDYGDRFDTFGNLAAILFGLANPKQTDCIFDFIRGAGLAEPWPIEVLTPAVNPGERDWRDYYRIRNLNQPRQYHNGGAWPFIGGFFVAALVKAGRMDEARRQLGKLAEMNRRSRFGGEWEFNEWFHGESGEPMGFPGQSWSAAMYLFAHESVRRGACPVFDPAHGW